MKKKQILFIVSLTILSINLFSQQLPVYSQYMLNGFLLNPAMAGNKDYIPVVLTVRQQWVGIDEAPQTYALSAHANPFLSKNMGIGGYIYNDNFGPVSRTGLMASYSYHLKLDMKNKIAFGLSLSGFQYKLDGSKLTLSEQDDPAITQGTESSFVPDANLGTFIYGEKYWAGVSVAQLFQWKADVGQSINDNKMVRHYFVSAGYKFNLDKSIKNFEVEPSLLFKATEKRSPLQVDLNVKAVYKKNYWLGVSYRSMDALIVLLGVKFDKYYFGYAFDYTLSKISDYSKGSHEIMLGINLFEGANKGSSLL